MSNEMNQDRFNLFLGVYRIELEKAHLAYPDQYAWEISELDTIVQRMGAAIAKGSFNKDSHAFKATCKAFGLKHTYRAINEFLTGVSK